MRKLQRHISRSPLVTGFLLLFFSPSPVMAIQSHGQPEGLYAHQIGHLLFGLAMIGFAIRILISRLVRQKPWQQMAAGAILLACWNGWAFIAHVLDEVIPLEDFLMNEHGVKAALKMLTPVDWFYYLFKMDHLISVPALLLIYLALRGMNSEPSSLSSGKNS